MIINRKRGVFWGIALCVIVILIIIYSNINPEDSYFFPKCPFKALTGFDCPGCGSQRAVHSLLHFDITSAFRANPLFILSLPYIIIGLLFDIVPLKNEKLQQMRKLLYGRSAICIVFLIVFAYWIFRNVVGG